MFKRIQKLFPDLVFKLVQADIKEKPEIYLKKSFIAASAATIAVCAVLAALLVKRDVSLLALPFIAMAVFAALLMFFIKRADVAIVRKQREFDKEIVFAGRYFVVELRSGVPVYDVMVNVSRSYRRIGNEFRQIINQVNLGTPFEEAINKSIDLTPSNNFRMFLWQILNSIKTGADLASALSATLDQITSEQVIMVKEYGRKLNPLVMFYMVFAVIFPSIGMIMLISFSTFFSLHINLVMLMSVAAFVALVQLFFLNIIRSQRPAIWM